jgi:hypothetical protein
VGVVLIDDSNKQLKGDCSFSEALYPKAASEITATFTHMDVGGRYRKLILNLNGNLFEYHIDSWSEPVYNCSGGFKIVSGRMNSTPEGNATLELDVINPTDKEFEVQMEYIMTPESGKGSGGIDATQMIEVSKIVQTLLFYDYVPSDVDSIQLNTSFSCWPELSSRIKRDQLICEGWYC